MRVKSIALAVMTAGSLVCAADAAAQVSTTRTLELTFHADNTVTLIAQNVTPREIIYEWSRRCGCYIVNAEKMVGGPITIPVRFEKARQSVVLESVLRQTAGYALTPRRAGAAGPSEFETIYVLATSSPSASAYPATSYSTVQAPPVTPGSPADEIPPAVQQQLQAPQLQPQQQPPQPGQPIGYQPGQMPGAQPQLNRPAPTGPGVFVPISPVGPTTPGAPPKGGSPTPPLGGGPIIRGGGGQ